MQRKFKILLVDDREENLFTLEALLEGETRDIITATSGKMALEILLSQEVDLILSDVNMPNMNGFELVETLRSNKNTCEIDVIFVSGAMYELKDMVNGYEKGAIDYMVKPIDPIITKLKVSVFERMFNQKQRLLAQNKEMKRMNEELDRFASIVSHDLKAPLRGINIYTGFMKRAIDAKDMNKLEGYFGDLNSTVGEMHRLIEGILDYSRKGFVSDHVEWVDVKLLIEKTIGLLNPKKAFELEFEGDFPVIYSSHLGLKQVFMNLISNSFKYTQDEVVRLKFSARKLEEEEYEFIVKDNGSGISSQYHKRIFDIFQKGGRTGAESTGIGLSIVKKIVKELDGNIWLESEVGVGTTFYFTIKQSAIKAELA